MKSLSQKIIIGAVLLSLVGGQFFLLKPKPAEAFWGVGDFSFDTQVADWYDVFKIIAVTAAERIAISYANKFITRFVDKLIDKYRIKDYLAYDKVLSGYYLNNYIYNNVSDPDLRAIYTSLATFANNSVTVTKPGQGTQPLVAALRKKIETYYYNRGGINSDLIYNPTGRFATDQQYFATAQAFFANPPNFAEQQIYANYGSILSASSGAAAAEIANNKDGLKNDRTNPTGFLSYICVGGLRYPQIYTDPDTNQGIYYPQDPIKNKEDCALAGGEWKADTTSMLQSVIQNPSSWIHDHVTGGIQKFFDANLTISTENPASVVRLFSNIGTFLGDFLFNKMNLDKTDPGVLNESGTVAKPDSGVYPMLKEIDLDKDNIPDGQDADGDGKLISLVDVCYHGGVPPKCKNSGSVQSSPYFTPICTSIDRAVTTLSIYAQFLDDHAELMEEGAQYKGLYQTIMSEPIDDFSRLVLGTDDSGGTVDNFINEADADIWARRAQSANSAVDDVTNSIQSYHSTYFDTPEITINRYAHFMSRITQSLQQDLDLDLARIGSGGGGLGNLIKNTAYTVRYLAELKRVIGKCENPNLQAVAVVPAPVINEPGDGGPADPCTALDDEIKAFTLDLLNTQKVSASETTNRILQKYPSSQAAYYPADMTTGNPYKSEYISIPAWYASEPEDKPHVPGDWAVIERCAR